MGATVNAGLWFLGRLQTDADCAWVKAFEKWRSLIDDEALWLHRRFGRVNARIFHSFRRARFNRPTIAGTAGL